MTEENAEDMDPSVPPELLEIHLDLERKGMTPEEWAEMLREEE